MRCPYCKHHDSKVLDTPTIAMGESAVAASA